MLSSLEIAKYLIELSIVRTGKSISNLRLQKYEYYAQAYFLGLYKVPLFMEEIEAWEHGPVVPDVYRKYKQHGKGLIPLTEHCNIENFSAEQLAMLDFIVDEFSKYSTTKLYDMVHKEPLYLEAYKQDAWTKTIQRDTIAEYYSNKIEANDIESDRILIDKIKGVINNPDEIYYSIEEAEKFLGLAN